MRDEKGARPQAPGNVTLDGDYIVGKGKPPDSGKFRAGDGRQRGRRPKGTRNLATDLRAELDARVTVNVGAEGTLHTFHVPRQGLAEREFQTTQLFPMKRWVRVTTYIDFRADGVIATWQDGKLTSAARIEGGAGVLEQAHFGLYAPPDLLEGTVFNDDLTIWHLDP